VKLSEIETWLCELCNNEKTEEASLVGTSFVLTVLLLIGLDDGLRIVPTNQTNPCQGRHLSTSRLVSTHLQADGRPRLGPCCMRRLYARDDFHGR
jgi:hypothetical protein